MTVIKTAKESAYLVNVLYKETCKFTFYNDILWYSSCKWPIFPAKKQRKKLSLIDKYNKDRYGHIIVMENICFKKYLCINWSFSHWKRDARKKESQPRNNDKHQLENTFLCHSKAHSTHSLSTTWAIVCTWHSMDHNTCDT